MTKKVSKDKVQVIVTDETGKEIPFYTKTLTALFKNKEGKKYKIAIEEPGKPRVDCGEYVVQGTVTPPSHECPDKQHWDEQQQKCVDDVVTPPQPHDCGEGKHWDDATQKCVDDVVEPPGSGTLLYDSNTDINWDAITGSSQVVTDVYGEFKPNGKYFRMKASGSPKMILMKDTKELLLEHGGKYGRAYFGVCNYASRLEAEFKLTDASHNASFKTRNRHQFADVQSGAPDNKRQGGQGSSFAVDKVDADLEVVHGTEISGPSKSLSPKLEVNKYYKMRFSQYDKNGKIHVVDELDRGNGFEVVNEGDVNAPQQFFNKAEFEQWSEFWVRANMDNGGRMYFKNIKMYAL